MFHPIHRWHIMLNMPKYDEEWHQRDMEEELAEYHDARGLIDSWSELSDVVYTYTRARWSGHTSLSFPFPRTMFCIGALYMIPKYTLRWKFFRALGHRFNAHLHISEVRNPRKIEKLETIAKKYDLDPERFVSKAQTLMHYWIFLK